MKSIISLLLFTNIVFANNMYNLGSKIVQIVQPENSVKVTEKAPKLHRFFNNLAATDYINDTLASFVDISFAEKDKSRYYLVKIDKTLKDVDFTASNFKDLSDGIKANLNDFNKYFDEKEFKDSMDTFLKKYSKDDTFKKVSMIPISINKDTDNMISFSAFFKYETLKGTVLIPATSVFTVINDRLLYFYTYGYSDSVDWTKNASEEWIKKVLEENYIP